MSQWREEILGDGQVRLILGDCREVLPTLGKVDAVVTGRHTENVLFYPYDRHRNPKRSHSRNRGRTSSLCGPSLAGICRLPGRSKLSIRCRSRMPWTADQSAGQINSRCKISSTTSWTFSCLSISRSSRRKSWKKSLSSGRFRCIGVRCARLPAHCVFAALHENSDRAYPCARQSRSPGSRRKGREGL